MTSPSPPLLDQIKGKWNVLSFTREQYSPATHTSNNWQVSGLPTDYIEFFTTGNMHVKCDPEPFMIWSCLQVDHVTLNIDNRIWVVRDLGHNHLKIELTGWDNNDKNWEAVYFHLNRKSK